MNRSLDYRTDFYSFGVTFYELLTIRESSTFSSNLDLAAAVKASTNISRSLHHPLLTKKSAVYPGDKSG